MANAECRIIREDRIRKQETLRAIEDSVSRTLPSADGLMDLRVEQRERANELAAQGFFLVAQGVDHLVSPDLGNCRLGLSISGRLMRRGRRSPSASTEEGSTPG